MSNVFIDTNIAFLENNDFIFRHRNKNFLTTKEKLSLKQSENCLSKEGIFKVNLFAGLNSSYSNNQILNSDFYKKDDTLSKNIEPFNDSANYKGNNLSFSMNPHKIYVTYGQDNSSEVFEELKNNPFEDIDSDESIEGYFFNAENITYPKYFSDYAIDKLTGSISVIGIIEELKGERLSESPLKGIKGQLVKNGQDARGRQVNISNKSRATITNNSVEGFFDGLNDQNILNNSSQVTGNFKFEDTLLNNNNIVVFKSDVNAISTINLETSSEFYRLEDNNNIEPFDDRDSVEITNNYDLNVLNNGYNKFDNYETSGTSNNNINGGLPESIIFLGDIN